jgi:outer membrane protein assembly factor BamB
VVREDYYGFPRGESNVYCLEGDLRLRWRAELPRSSDVYAHPIFVTSAGVVCASWEGYTCTLDPATGRIRSKVLTR